MRKKNLIYLLFVPLFFISCATSVSYNVIHPPLVDLRDTRSITVIPLEWGSSAWYKHLSMHLTSALVNGLKKGTIPYINSYTLDHVNKNDYFKYFDVYITGKLVTVNSWSDTQAETIFRYGSERIRYITTRYVTVDIEYKYIRSVDEETLGVFRKSETASDSYDQYGYPEHRGRHGRGRSRGRLTGRPPFFNEPPLSGTWQEKMAETAISGFSDTMSREISHFTTTERGIIRRISRRDTPLKEAKIAYNAAVLMAVNGNYAQAIEMLETAKNGLILSNKRIPAYIKNEIIKYHEFNEKQKILNDYKNYPAPVFSNVETVSTASNEIFSGIAGITNLENGIIYALSDSIVSMDDDSVFSKIVSVTQSERGLWSMQVPDKPPDLLWFVVTDGSSEYYISKTALSIKGIIILDIALMDKLRTAGNQP